ncbi:MAG: hypothetical protein HC938_13200 [Nitrospira sp.]|nr:hypothetical protein [Nitrospira sp.]
MKPLPDMMMVGLSMVVTICATVLSDGAVTPVSAQTVPNQSVIEKAFPHSNKCKRCHERVYEEWETSPLAKSIHSPAFRASLDAYLKSAGGKDQALCFRCHAPHVREFSDPCAALCRASEIGRPVFGWRCLQPVSPDQAGGPGQASSGAEV